VLYALSILLNLGLPDASDIGAFYNTTYLYLSFAFSEVFIPILVLSSYYWVLGN